MEGQTLKDEYTERLRSLKRRHAKRRTPRYRSLLAHWAARALLPPSRAEVAPLPKPQAGQVAVTYAGHATALVRYHDLAVLCDPHLGDWCGAVHREVRAGLSPAELSDVDLILLSGQSPDHLDPKTLSQLPKSATVIVPPYSARYVSSFGFARVMELSAGQNVEHRSVNISALMMQPGRDKAPSLAYMLRGSGPGVFFCGSSGYFDGFSRIGKEFRPEIALLPIGGFSPFRKEHMSPLDALCAFEDLGSKIMIPIRYGSFALSYEKMHVPGRWLAELVSERALDEHVLAIAPGQSRIFVRPSTAKSNTVEASTAEVSAR